MVVLDSPSRPRTGRRRQRDGKRLPWASTALLLAPAAEELAVALALLQHPSPGGLRSGEVLGDRAAAADRIASRQAASASAGPAGALLDQALDPLDLALASRQLADLGDRALQRSASSAGIQRKSRP